MRIARNSYCGNYSVIDPLHCKSKHSGLVDAMCIYIWSLFTNGEGKYSLEGNVNAAMVGLHFYIN